MYKRQAAWSSTAANWTKIATVDLETTDDFWIGDIDIDLSTGVIWFKSKGSGDSVGVGDRQYNGGDGTGWREALRRGSLWDGSSAGFSYANLRNDVTNANWNYALCFYMSDGTK